MRHHVSQRRKVAVLGASGHTGRLTVQAALAQNLDVIALTRRGDSIVPSPSLSERRWPEIDDAVPLVEALDGVDAVISCLGGATQGPTAVCTDGIRSAIAAMNRTGVRRLVAVSAYGVRETHDGSLYSRAVWASVPERMRDKESMESLIVASDLDWVIVRPPKLSDRRATGRFHVGIDLPIRIWSSIGRDDLAAFLVSQADSPQYLHACPRIAQ